MVFLGKKGNNKKKFLLDKDGVRHGYCGSFGKKRG